MPSTISSIGTQSSTPYRALLILESCLRQKCFPLSKLGRLTDGLTSAPISSKNLTISKDPCPAAPSSALRPHTFSRGALISPPTSRSILMISKFPFVAACWSEVLSLVPVVGPMFTSAPRWEKFTPAAFFSKSCAALELLAKLAQAIRALSRARCFCRGFVASSTPCSRYHLRILWLEESSAARTKADF